MKQIEFGANWAFNSKGGKREVTLPHDAQLLDDRDASSEGGSGHGYFVGNIYTYEKHFDVPEDWANKHIEILFEGIYKNATVYLNSIEIASHKYGYTPFTVSLDEYLIYGEQNIIVVVVDNSKLPNSRWYTGGGIYRPVSLLLSDKEHIAFQGVKVRTLSINPAKIKVEVAATSSNIRVEILNKGEIIATAIGNNVEIEIPDAQLWSDEMPYLYAARAKLFCNDVVVDEDTVDFGIRTLEWNKNGFFVNGKNKLLRGGCVHHDNGVVGAASFPESEFRRVKILKENGFNAIRVSHNPAATAMLEACDRYGLYVMDETFDMWYLRKTKYDYGVDFKTNWESDIKAMVDRDYNHPSVVMYSIGNEVSEPGKPEGVEQGKRIISFIRNLDSTRAITGGINLMIMSNYVRGKGHYENVDGEQKSQEKQENEGAAKEAKNGSLIFNTLASFLGPRMNSVGNSDKVDKITSPILDALDIAGYNYANGRYPLEATKHPNRVVVGSETFPYEIGKNWDMVKKYPYLIGDFMWTAWDYIGEAGLGAWSYTGGLPFNRPYPWLLGGTGVIDILGNPDASLGLAKVVWDVEKKPVIGVRPVNHPGVRVTKSVWRGTNAIESWSWKGCEGNKAEIDVFANANAVELIVNGKSIGKKKIKNYQVLYKTQYEPGSIVAIAYNLSGKEISRNELKSANGVIKTVIVPEKQVVASGEVFYINIERLGQNGIVESNDDKSLKIVVEGGELLGFGSANPCTEESFVAGEYTTYYGRAQAVIRALNADIVKITIISDGDKVTKEIKIVNYE